MANRRDYDFSGKTEDELNAMLQKESSKSRPNQEKTHAIKKALKSKQQTSKSRKKHQSVKHKESESRSSKTSKSSKSSKSSGSSKSDKYSTMNKDEMKEEYNYLIDKQKRYQKSGEKAKLVKVDERIKALEVAMSKLDAKDGSSSHRSGRDKSKSKRNGHSNGNGNDSHKRHDGSSSHKSHRDKPKSKRNEHSNGNDSHDITEEDNSNKDVREILGEMFGDLNKDTKIINSVFKHFDYNSNKSQQNIKVSMALMDKIIPESKIVNKILIPSCTDHIKKNLKKQKKSNEHIESYLNLDIQSYPKNLIESYVDISFNHQRHMQEYIHCCVEAIDDKNKILEECIEIEKDKIKKYIQKDPNHKYYKDIMDNEKKERRLEKIQKSNLNKLMELCDEVFENVTNEPKNYPNGLRVFCKDLKKIAIKENMTKNEGLKLVGQIMNNSIATMMNKEKIVKYVEEHPELYKKHKDNKIVKKNLTKNLRLIAETIMNISNKTKVIKEQGMGKLLENKYFQKKYNDYDKFCNELCHYKSNKPLNTDNYKNVSMTKNEIKSFSKIIYAERNNLKKGELLDGLKGVKKNFYNNSKTLMTKITKDKNWFEKIEDKHKKIAEIPIKI